MLQCRSVSAVLAVFVPIVVLAVIPAVQAVEPVVVTATRTAETADESLASVTVLTRRDLERLQAATLQSLLQGLAGIEVTNSGGTGKQTSVFLRGAEADHLIVLVDGIKVGSASLGLAAFQDLPPEQIERIEIVRGPRSSLYGSEALGGVIQIFTRQGRRGGQPSASISAASHRRFSLHGAFSGGGDTSQYALSVAALSTDGFDACAPATDSGCFTDEPDDDGYRNQSLTFRWDRRFRDTARLSIHGLRINAENEFDGSFVNESKSAQQVVGVQARFRPWPDWEMEFQGGRSLDLSQNFLDGAFRSRFDTRRDELTWQNIVTINDRHLLSLGMDWRKTRLNSDTDYTETQRITHALFSQWQGFFDRFDVLAGLRVDDRRAADRQTTGNLAFGIDLPAGTRLTLAAGTAFKTPTFNELYFPGFGNPELKPEQAVSLEIGLRRHTTVHSWRITAFRLNIDDLIGFDATTFRAVNIDQAVVTGIEADVQRYYGPWRWTITGTWLDPVNDSQGDLRGNRLPRRAERSIRMELDYTHGRIGAGATFLASGPRFDDLANTRELGGYGVVDLRGHWQWKPAWRIQWQIGNLFDKAYETAKNFNQDGRNVSLTLRYQPARRS